MNQVISGLVATAIAASFAFASAAPVAAAIYFPMPPKGEPLVEDVVYHGHVHRPVHVHPNARVHPNVRYHPNYHPNVRYHPNYHPNVRYHPIARNGGYYMNGHRGYRDYRPGYRNYNGWWYPAAAFVGGAVVGSAIASQPTYVQPSGYGNSHAQWCYNRYRSYRASDNTFQPSSGPRQQCYSPY